MRRKPKLSLRLSGLLPLRLADRQFWALLFQLPPRQTRLEHLLRPLPYICYYSTLFSKSKQYFSKKYFRRFQVFPCLIWPIKLSTEHTNSGNSISLDASWMRLFLILWQNRLQASLCSFRRPGKTLNPRKGIPCQVGCKKVAFALRRIARESCKKCSMSVRTLCNFFLSWSNKTTSSI